LYGPGQTIANEFARNPNGLTADTVLNGSTIFINPALIGGNLTSNEGLLFHETLHELGMVDTDIQAALGIRVWQEYEEHHYNASEGLHYWERK
jgi:hypothetical protein